MYDVCPKTNECLLPPAYVVRREGNSFTLLVCPHLGGRGSVLSPAGGWVSPAGGGGSAKIGQQNEYSLHGGRYASCVHAGGLSCFTLRKALESV